MPLEPGISEGLTHAQVTWQEKSACSWETTASSQPARVETHQESAPPKG